MLLCLGGGDIVALGQLDKIQSRACGLINSPIIINQQPKLQLRRDVASLSLFYRYFYGYWSDELRAITPPPLFRGRPTGVRSRLKVNHLQFLLIAHLHLRNHFCFVQLKCGTHYHKNASLATSIFRSLKRNVTLSSHLWRFADSVQGAGSYGIFLHLHL